MKNRPRKNAAALISAFLLVLICFTAQSHASGTSDSEELRIAFLPIIDILPYYIAESAGYFKDENVSVSMLVVANPVERNRLMLSGEIDGMLNELSSVAVFNREKIMLKAVMTVRIPMNNSPYFRILASPDSGIKKPADLAGVDIAVSKNTIIEYLTDRILQAEGVAPENIRTKNVPVIPERFQLLMKGTIKAATLPDPLGQAAVKAGAVPVADDLAHPQFSLSVLSFRASLTESHRDKLKGFITAWNRAVKDLNADPESFRNLFLEKVRVPDNIQQSFEIPKFPVNHLPDKNQWEDVLDWLMEKKLLDSRPDYSSSIVNLF